MPQPYEQATRLHAPIQPFDKGFLTRGHHQIYYEQCGNPEGMPIIFLHGGPGAGCAPAHRRLFDPQRYRAILFDQRGCGRSTPYASIDENSTQDLVEDIEALRQHLGVDKMLIFGGSWGSTLALCYGISYPEHALGFILRGIFLGSAEEINWFLYDMGRFYPEAHKEFVDYLPLSDQADILDGYYKQMTGLSSGHALAAAQKWAAYENSCATLVAEQRSAGQGALAIALVEAHYFKHNCFLEDGYILDNIDVINHLPAVIVNGRHDVICPPFSAQKLYDKWGEEAQLKMIDDAGHSAFESGILWALLKGLDQLASKI